MKKCLVTCSNVTGRILRRECDAASTAEALRESLAVWLESRELKPNERLLNIMAVVMGEVEGLGTGELEK